MKQNLLPTRKIKGFDVRPGFYELNGATALENAVNFTVHSQNATACSVALFKRTEQKPYAVIPIPDSFRIGNTWSIMIFGLDIYDFEYCYRLDGPYEPEKGLIFDKNRNVLDIYAKAVTGQSVWGKKAKGDGSYHARVHADLFDWGDCKQPDIKFQDLVIYELHVRGFTMDSSSGVAARGTFAGVIEKIPYLKKLGINAVELMPIFEFDELDSARVVDGQQLLNYWGYSPTAFFAPNTSYASAVEYNREGDELKMLIRTLHENKILVFLDVVFNHTSEGDEHGSAFSFKGLDNSVYYMLTPDGHYYNFSGCGNTVNCNHPIVQQFIVDCLRYWVVEYRVDGFRFDLATILGRNEDGSPMPNPPLLKTLAFDPILSRVKLIAEAWDAGGLYQVGSFPSWNRWAEWNGRFRDDLRRFLKGDSGMAQAAVNRITGSEDIYDPRIRGYNASVNFLTCHDGFTLYDLYSYNEKHNEKNGWNNTDGSDDNYSWNCGAEGETDDKEINGLRLRLIKNAFTALMLSRGAVMFPAGDEMCKTQSGNNNAYCQDNETSWLDWERLKRYGEIFEYVKDLLTLRKKHRIIRKNTQPISLGFENITYHHGAAWNGTLSDSDHVIGIMYSGKKKDGSDDAVYLAFNTYWETVDVTAPELMGYSWQARFYTGVPYEKGALLDTMLNRRGNTFTLAPRSAMVLVLE